MNEITIEVDDLFAPYLKHFSSVDSVACFDVVFLRNQLCDLLCQNGPIWQGLGLTQRT